MFLIKKLKQIMLYKVPLGLLLAVFLAFIILPLLNIGLFQSAVNKQSYTMVKYIEEAQETVFLNVGIESVETQTNNTKIPWTSIGIPLSEKKAIIILNYQAKLGIKEPAKISEVATKKYKIEIPKYEVIGVNLDEENPYRLYDSSGELLSYSTKEIDTGELVSERLSSAKQAHYLEQYQKQMNDSAKSYYQSLFKSIDQEIQLELVYPK